MEFLILFGIAFAYSFARVGRNSTQAAYKRQPLTPEDIHRMNVSTIGMSKKDARRYINNYKK